MTITHLFFKKTRHIYIAFVGRTNLQSWIWTCLGAGLCSVTYIPNTTSIFLGFCKDTELSRAWKQDPFWQKPRVTWLSGPSISSWGNRFARKVPHASPQFPFTDDNGPFFSVTFLVSRVFMNLPYLKCKFSFKYSVFVNYLVWWACWYWLSLWALNSISQTISPFKLFQLC